LAGEVNDSGTNQLVQSRNIKFKIKAFDSGEPAFDIAREQLGIFGGEFFARQRRGGRTLAIED
jgi:hypothetical protein